MPTSTPSSIPLRLLRTRHILLVLSGKGGVGKSSVAVQLALSLLHLNNRSSRVGLLDIDLTGPSVPRMLGMSGGAKGTKTKEEGGKGEQEEEDAWAVHQSEEGWVPVYLEGRGPGSISHPTNPTTTNTSPENSSNKGKDGNEIEDGGINHDPNNYQEGSLACMSIGFLLKNSRESVVWRGPKKGAMIKQFLNDVRWGELDWLVVDTPPGTSDEHISLLELLSPLLAPPSFPPYSYSSSSPPPYPVQPTLHSVLVSTPQALALLDVSKELSFCRKVSLPVIGLIENMSGYVCPNPKCGKVAGVFGRGGGEDWCRGRNEAWEREKKKRIDEKQKRIENNETENENGKEDPEEETVETRGCRWLGRIPIDRGLVQLMDGGAVAAASTSTTSSTQQAGAAFVAVKPRRTRERKGIKAHLQHDQERKDNDGVDCEETVLSGEHAREALKKDEGSNGKEVDHHNHHDEGSAISNSSETIPPPISTDSVSRPPSFLTRYSQTSTFPLFLTIARDVVKSVEEDAERKKEIWKNRWEKERRLRL